MPAELAEELIAEEGICTWMYLDTAKNPVVTCGIGHAIFTVQNALVLPWNQPEAAIRWDYQAVLSAPKGYKASWYANLTKCRLSEAFVRQLLEADIEAQIFILKKHFPRYNHYPASVKRALGDLAFNLGGDWPIKKRENGLLEWPRLTQAVRSEKWEDAAMSCHRIDVSEARNKRAAERFRQGVTVAV